MRQARVDGRLVSAGPDAPDVAECPECGGEVRKRSRHVMDGHMTYFYRHKRGVGQECSLRYRP
jgi:hypothetical protein